MTKESTTDINHHFTNTGVVQPPRPNNNPGVAAKVFEGFDFFIHKDDAKYNPGNAAKVFEFPKGVALACGLVMLGVFVYSKLK